MGTDQGATELRVDIRVEAKAMIEGRAAKSKMGNE